MKNCQVSANPVIICKNKHCISKCKTAKSLGLIYKFVSADGIEVDLPSEIIEIYSYRNGIHIIAEQRKGISYELDLSKRAYRRMRPFIDQLKEKLVKDGKI